MKPVRALTVAVILVGASGCPMPDVRSAATIGDLDLPSDPGELSSAAAAYFEKGDPVSLENALVAYDKLIQLQPTDYEALWRAARAAFAVADRSERDEPRRSKFADDGMRYAKQAIAQRPRGIEGHYYLALNTGYLAKTKSVGALGLLPDIQKEAQTSIQLDEKFDHAGPHRLLGALLVKAPGWPSSIGDVDEGQTQLARAVELDPAFPPNHIFFAEALMANDRCADAKRELELGLGLPPPGDSFWDRQMARWKREAEELRKKIAEKC